MVRLRQALFLIVVAIVCAVVSNLLASPSRKLAWVGSYPNALVVPTPAAAAAPAPPAPVAPTPPTAATPPAAPSSAAVPAKDYPPHPDKPWVDIGGDEAAALHGRGVPFLDARRTSVYIEGHIAGARSFPIWESTVDNEIKKLFDEGYDVNAPLVIYCSGGDCEDSHMLAQRLHGYGFNDALVYTGGFPDWEKRGLPVEKGPPK
jgi:rhodanese-related sulfurtransferase